MSLTCSRIRIAFSYHESLILNNTWHTSSVFPYFLWPWHYWRVWADSFVDYPFMPVSLTVFGVMLRVSFVVWPERVCFSYPLTDFVSVFFLCHIAPEVIHLKHGFIHVSSYTKKTPRVHQRPASAGYSRPCVVLSPVTFPDFSRLVLTWWPWGRLNWVFHFLCWTLWLHVCLSACLACVVYIIIVFMLQARKPEFCETYRLAQGWQPDLILRLFSLQKSRDLASTLYCQLFYEKLGSYSSWIFSLNPVQCLVYNMAVIHVSWMDGSVNADFEDKNGQLWL